MKKQNELKAIGDDIGTMDRLANFKYEIRVRYSETDMSGYPHHSKYFIWLEESRHALLREMGLSYGDMEKEGLFFPVIDATCRFIESVKMDDEIEIYPTILKANRRLIKIGYSLFNKNTGVKIATAETTNIAVNADRHVISVPETYLSFLAKIKQLQAVQEKSITTTRGGGLIC